MLAAPLAGALVVLTALSVREGARGRRSDRLVSRVRADGSSRPEPPAAVPRRSGPPSREADGRAVRARLERFRAPGWLVRRVDAAALPLDADPAWRAWSAMSVPIVLIAAAVGGLVLATTAAVAWLVVPLAGLRSRRGAAGRAVEGGLADALEALARSLRSGAGTSQALAEVAAATGGHLGVELRATVRDIGGGVSLHDALGSLERRRPEPGVRLAVAALALGADAGGAHARALDSVAATVRARLGVAREVRALSSQARLSAVVIAAAPVAFAALAAGTDASGATFLLRTPGGQACLAAGLTLDGVGALWMHRLAQVDA